MTQITFVRSNFRSSLTLDGEALPTSIINMLLEGNMASILGDDGDPEGEGAMGPLWPWHPVVLAPEGQCLLHKPVP